MWKYQVHKRSSDGKSELRMYKDEDNYEVLDESFDSSRLHDDAVYLNRAHAKTKRRRRR